MSILNLEHQETNRPVSLAHSVNAVRAAAALVSVWIERASNRRQLRDLLRYDQRLLQDIGLRHDEIMSEAFKSFWRE